jgi:hypothetical protein
MCYILHTLLHLTVDRAERINANLQCQRQRAKAKAAIATATMHGPAWGKPNLNPYSFMIRL